MKTTAKVLLVISSLFSLALHANTELEMTSKLKPSKHTRDNWYIEFALYPAGEMRVDHERDSNQKLNADARFGAQFGVGATVNQKLLIGGELNSFVLFKDTKHSTFQKTEASISNTNLMAVATFFPWEEGLFFRGGLGLSNASVEVKEKALFLDYKHTDSMSGYGLVIGTGYAWWIGKSFNMSAKLDYNHSFYNKEIFKQNVNTISYWTAGIGFHWF